MFQFANPHILWLLLTIPAMVIALMAISQLRKRNIAKFGNPSTLYALMPDLSSVRRKIKGSLFLLAVTAVIFAAARPQFGSKLKEQTSQGVEMMLVVDISNSMLAEDFAPNRLDRTRYAIDNLNFTSWSLLITSIESCNVVARKCFIISDLYKLHLVGLAAEDIW